MILEILLQNAMNQMALHITMIVGVIFLKNTLKNNKQEDYYGE